MPPKAKPTKDTSTATIGLEAKLWLSADSRGEAETAEGNRSNNMDAAETSGASKTAVGSPKGERGGANQYSRAERDRPAEPARRASAGPRVKYISDTFDEHHAKLVAGKGDFKGASPEDKDEYLAANVFWVPKDARWPQLQSRAKLPSIGKDVGGREMTNVECGISNYWSAT